MNTSFQNPFNLFSEDEKLISPCILVIYGATGDLTARKLMPALYNLDREGLLPSHFVCVGVARREKTDAEFREEMRLAVAEFSRTKPLDPQFWEAFSQKIFYFTSKFEDDDAYTRLKEYLQKLDSTFHTKGNRLFYLSTQSSYFPLIIEKLGTHSFFYPLESKEHTKENRWSRVIIEKPFGHDLDSSLSLQEHITKYLKEEQIFRIDHYLAKETVQNLLLFRFANPIFESVWNNRYIKYVEMTVSEDIGVGSRGNLWEESGLVRDIIQNHMMQLLSLVTMEPPRSFESTAIHDEKVKVLESIRPFPLDKIDHYAVRGQYGRGYVNGKEVIAYREENNVSKDSHVETFAAIKIFIDNFRFFGVPFYLRSGKRLAKKTTEIAIIFKEAPSFLFHNSTKTVEPNILVIRIQPDEGISLKINCKVPGMNETIEPVKMDFKYDAYFGSASQEAYERLICDAIAGDSTLFARFDEVSASWKLFTPLLNHWQNTPSIHFPNYKAGSLGPDLSHTLMEEKGHTWRFL